MPAHGWKSRLSKEQTAAGIASSEANPELARELNEAQRILIAPHLRLRHLLELMCPGEKPTDGPVVLPKVLAGWFDEAVMLEGKLNAFLARRNAASSPLGRALLAREAMTLREAAEAWLVHLAAHESEWLKALRELDARWHEEDPAARSCEALALFAQTFAYLGRWRDTVRERSFALAET